MKSISYILIGIITLMLVMPMVSAWKSYDDKTTTASITTFLGSKVSDIKLDTPRINYVPHGKNILVAQMTFNNYKEENFYNTMEFYDKNKANSKIDRTFTFKYIKDYTYQTIKDEAKVEQECGYHILNKSDMDNFVVGKECEFFTYRTNTIATPIWETINKDSKLPLGKITIGIFTDVQEGDYVEWIPTFYGYKIEEWATWQDSLSVGLTDYFKLDETTGSNASNSIRTTNVAVKNATNAWVVGKINNGANASTGYFNITNDTSSGYNYLFNGMNNVSISMWVYPYADGYPNHGYICKSQVQLGSGNKKFFFGTYTGNKLYFIMNDNNDNQAIAKTGDIIPTGKWTHVVLVYDGGGNISNASMYINGSLQSITLDYAQVMTDLSNIYPVMIGHGTHYSQTNNPFFGLMDEVAFWNRSLSSTEVTALYNSGAGIQYQAPSTESTISINNITWNESTMETATESFRINVTYNNTYWTAITGNLVYDGTIYASTKTTELANTSIFTNTLSLPLGTGVKSFYWNLRVTNSSGTFDSNTTTKTQNVSGFNLTLCNGGKAYLNFTFRNESDAIGYNMSASVPLSTFEYYIGDGTYKKTLTFINTSENPSYAFCFTPADRSVNIDAYLQYSASGFPQKTYNPAATLYSNTTTNILLYLLASSDGIIDTTQVVNYAGQQISGVVVTVSREISGVPTQVASGTTGDDGAVTFFLNPDYQHTYVFSKIGYTTKTISMTPTTSGHTITLSSLYSSNTSDYSIGITYAIKPGDFQLKNNTIYEFNYTLTNTLNVWDITNFGFSLRNSSGTILNSTSATTNGGVVRATLDTSTLKQITMDYYYVANNTYINLSRSWIVYDDEAGNDWSIKVFFTDLTTYANQGIFGLDQFGFTLILFVIIFVFVGVMSYKFGFTSPAAISILIFGVVGLFDVLGLLKNIAGETFGHLTVIVCGLIMLGMFFRESSR